MSRFEIRIALVLALFVAGLPQVSNATTPTFTEVEECVISSGVLTDPYSGETINFLRGVATSSEIQIDHVVALSNAWQTGAFILTLAQRTAFAKDPSNLLAFGGGVNISHG